MNNNWIEELDILRKKPPTYDELKTFISNLLTQKDQEHKAELEMIKGEIESKMKLIAHTDDMEFVMDIPRSYTQEIRYTIYAFKDAISILNNHINKISKE